MNKKYRISLIVIVIVLVFVGTASAKVYQEDDLSTDPDTQYLYEMAHDTWNCIDYYVDDKTGLPYDNSEDRTYTGIDKIGLYIASVAVAKELGFISKDEAINKVNKTLNTLLSEDFKTWNGSCTPYESSNIRIPYTWYNMTTLDPLPPTDIDVCTIDLGNYYACLIIGKSAFPELNQSFSKLLDDVNWSLLYDYNENIFYGGYNTKTCNYSTWHCNYSASDSQTASFIGIATEAVPAKHWEILNRCFEEWHGYRYYVGRVCGLYSQLLPGIFIDQRQTLMGISAKNLTSGDIAHAKNTSSPVWGWSASSSVPVDISDTIAIIFYYKGTGSSNTLQFKLEDEDASIFGKRLYNATNMSEWTKARINYSELDYYGGGDNSPDLKNITGIVFAIESGERDGIPVGEGGNGTLSISNITLESADKTIGINFYGSWYQGVDNGTNLSLSVDQGNKIINMTYDLGEGNKWVSISKKFGNLDYLGCGHLQDQIVTPHASILALSYFHKEVIENLNKLEEMRARDPILIDGRNYSFGFRDAINWKSGKISGKYLTLDQAMIFLSIANYLNSTVWRLFMEDSVSKKGVSLIEDYRGHIIYFAEGEDLINKSGGGLDNKPHASNCSCLGNGWGNNGEYAEYLINLSEDADKVLFKMRYSDNFDANNTASRIRVYLDGELKGGLFTENTYDWDEFQWSDPVYIGYVPAGEHELELISGNGGEWNCINLDCFKLYNVDIVISNIISNVTITKITATNATITWQTNVPADSYIHWRGFYNIFNSWADPNEYIQGITYVPPNSKSKIDEDLEDIKNHNFNIINTYELEKLDPEVGEYIFDKCKKLGLKIAFRLEWYNECSFNYSCEDADNILRHYNTSIGYAKKYPESVLCYVINMPLDDLNLTISTKEQQRNYVSCFYNKLKEIDPDHPIYVNFYYGWADELPQASVADIADGITFTVYAMRCSGAPYGDDQTPNFTDSNYKISGKDQYDYYIDKIYEENNLFILNKPLLIDTGFADWFKNPDQRNGVVADKKTKAKAINLFKEYLKNNSKVSGWFYFKLYDKPEEATWGLIDEGNILNRTLTMNHSVQLTNFFPNTTYKFEVQSGDAISSGHEFATKSIPVSNRPPTITITSPTYGNEITGENYTITWTDDDPDNDANISLYYDKNDSGYEGVLIVGGISEDDEVDDFIWNISILPIGSYFIYAKIEDGINPPEYDYSSGQIISSLDQIVAIRTERTITIDGVLNESDWSKAEWLTFALHPKKNDNTTTKVKLLWDDEYLYAGFDVTDEHVETSEEDWNDNSVSIIINNGRLLKYRQDIGGSGEGICKRNFTLNGKTTIDDNSDIDTGYYVEMKIPWAYYVDYVEKKGDIIRIWTSTRVIPSLGDIIPLDFLSVDHDNNPGSAWDDPKTIFSKISWDGDGNVTTTGKSAKLFHEKMF